MYNKKTLAVIGMTALMLVTMAGCGSKNNSAAEVKTTTATTAAPVKVENETKKSVTEATTEATTEAVTEAQTETQEAASEEVTEAVSEAPAEVVETPAETPVQAEVVTEAPVVVEVPAQVVVEKPEVVTEAKIETPRDEKGWPVPISSDTKGITQSGSIDNPDGTYTNHLGTWASYEAYREYRALRRAEQDAKYEAERAAREATMDASNRVHLTFE